MANTTTTTSSSASAPAPAASTAQPFHTASLYVGDIHPEVTEALLFEIFNAVGPVASIRVCRDAVTRRSLGYAYVNFHNVADAERALDTMNYTTIKDVPCRIMWSQRDPSLRKSGLGNIFVKNLDSSIDNKALYDTFSLFGNILSCKVVHDIGGSSKGYGYVHYETQEAADEAIEKINGMLIAGHEVYVGQFQKRQERPDEANWTNCYVKNIPTHWTDAELRKEFQSFGSISSCVVMANGSKTPEDVEVADEDKKDTPSEKKNKGFGFVNFEDPEAASSAVAALNGKIYKQEDGTDAEMFVGRAQKKGERERELRTKFEALKVERINKYQGVNLYVKNLDESVTEEQLRDAFTSFGTITSCRVMVDEAKNSRGFGFVCFSAPEEATKAVAEMNGKLVGPKPIYVALAQRKEVRRAQLEAQHQQRAAGMAGGRGMPMGQAPMFGAAPMFYAQPNQMPPQGRQGFVYPQQMMRGMPRGGAPGGAMPYGGGRGGPGGYQMPPQGYGMPMQQRGPRGGRRGGRGGPGGQHMPPRGMPHGQGQQNNQNNRNFKYTANARNQPPRGDAVPPPGPHAPMGGAAPSSNGMPHPPPVEPLTPAGLVNASEEQQKNMIGERLYPLIHREQPALAGKITGMLLEMDNGELLVLLESPEALTSKIQEAIQVLEAHNTEVTDAAQE